MKLELNDAILSPQDLQAVILDVRSYAKWFAQSSVKLQLSKAQLQDQPGISQVAAKQINDWIVQNPLSQNSLDELIKLLEELAKKLPKATVTLGAAPPLKLKQTIVAWFRDNLEPNMLVDFHFNSTLLGGMVVSYGSHIYDWSFRRQILAARGNFPEVLRRV